jgi:hypothetical protein
MKTLLLIVGLLLSSCPHVQASEAYANASLEEQPRILKASELLGYQISPEQASALLHAHNLTANEVGTDSTPAGIFPDGNSNFTPSQLRRKAKALVSGGFKLKEVELLMRAGLAGSSGVTGGAVPPPYGSDFYHEPKRSDGTLPLTEFEKYGDRVRASYRSQPPAYRQLPPPVQREYARPHDEHRWYRPISERDAALLRHLRGNVRGAGH